jgi:hypothetical protein
MMNSTEKAEQYEVIEGDPPLDDEDQGAKNQSGEEVDVRLSEELQDDEEARRELRRNERKTQKERQRYARDKTREDMEFLKQQNNLLLQRLEAVETHTLSAQRGNLDFGYRQAIGTVQVAEQQLAKAIEIGDGARVPELLRQRDHAMAKAAEINRAKQGFDAPRPMQQAPEVNQLAHRWAADNRWFNPNGSDEDSLVAKAVDSSLVAEGLNPGTDRYWSELNRRLAQRLPHRFADDDDSDYTPTQQGRRGPPVGGGRELSAPGSKKVFVSADRVQAMKDAGYWDDPVLRQRMMKRYAEADRELKAAR